MKNSLKIVFMGTPGFAVASLASIHASHHKVVAVITAPDRPAGRGRKLQASDVKKYALENELKILQPEKLKAPEFIRKLESLEADLFVVVAFRMLPEVVWAMPPEGTINLHASLLPDYRGAAPINWAIINGDTKTGLSTFFINEEIDKGHLIDSEEVNILDADNVGTLHDRLMDKGAGLLLNTINIISEGDTEAKPQEVEGLQLRKAPKLNPENRTIDWHQSAQTVHNLIRGLSPYPSAITNLIVDEEQKIKCKVYKSSLTEEEDLEIGEISTDNRSYIYVGTGQGSLSIEEIQLSGKRNMTVKELLNGFEIPKTARFASKNTKKEA